MAMKGRGGGLTPLQISSRFILQPQPTGQDRRMEEPVKIKYFAKENMREVEYFFKM